MHPMVGGQLNADGSRQPVVGGQANSWVSIGLVLGEHLAHLGLALGYWLRLGICVLRPSPPQPTPANAHILSR